MVDTIEQRLHDIDDAIALGRNQYLAAYFVGDTADDHDGLPRFV